MKITPEDIARALIETCRSLPESEQGAASEVAIYLLLHHRLARSVRSFPRIVQKMLTRSENVVFAQLVTPVESASTGEDMIASLEKALGKKIALSQSVDPSLIGGALLSVGDERFDASVHGSLARMRKHLAEGNLVA